MDISGNGSELGQCESHEIEPTWPLSKGACVLEEEEPEMVLPWVWPLEKKLTTVKYCFKRIKHVSYNFRDTHHNYSI